MPALTLANLALYAAQAALLIGALALVLAALRPAPVLRLAACRGLLVVLLLLPFQALLFEPSAIRAPMRPIIGGSVLAVDAVNARSGPAVPWGALVASLVAAGVSLRLVWLALGLARLRRLARDLPGALPEIAAGEIADLQADLGTAARVAFVDRVAQPVTFGIAPAIVLLPSPLLAAAADRRRAIVCHELLHVRRRDWLWVMGEELALTVLWFHPAAWWLVGELQLAREQVVDRLTVARTGARREYMNTLFSAADLPAAPPLLSGFLRRRHLARRLVSLAEEVVMSRARIVVGAVSVVFVLVGGGAVGLAAWPLAPKAAVAQEPEKMLFVPRPDGPEAGVRVERQTEVPFPNPTVEPPFGEVIVDVDATVDAAGDVSATKAVSVTVHGRNDNGEGLGTAATSAVDAAVASAVGAVRDWRFEAPPRTPAAVLVRIRFAAEPRAAAVTGVRPLRGYAAITPVLRSTQLPKKIINVQPVYPQEARDAKVTGIVVIEIVLDEGGNVHEAWVLKSVPMLDQAALDAVKEWKFEPALLNGAPVPVKCTVSVSFTLK